MFWTIICHSVHLECFKISILTDCDLVIDSHFLKGLLFKVFISWLIRVRKLPTHIQCMGELLEVGAYPWLIAARNFDKLKLEIDR